MSSFSDGLFLMIIRLSSISNKYFLFSWGNILKLSKKGEKLLWSKGSQTALDGLIFIWWFGLPSSQRWYIYMFTRSYIKFSHTFIEIGLIAETTLEFINNIRYKVFGYRVFATKRIGKPCLTFKKKNASLQQSKTFFNVCCSLFIVCKDINAKFERNRSKRFFHTVVMFSLTRWILFKKFLKH